MVAEPASIAAPAFSERGTLGEPHTGGCEFANSSWPAELVFFGFVWLVIVVLFVYFVCFVAQPTLHSRIFSGSWFLVCCLDCLCFGELFCLDYFIKLFQPSAGVHLFADTFSHGDFELHFLFDFKLFLCTFFYTSRPL